MSYTFTSVIKYHSSVHLKMSACKFWFLFCRIHAGLLLWDTRHGSKVLRNHILTEEAERMWGKGQKPLTPTPVTTSSIKAPHLKGQ